LNFFFFLTRPDSSLFQSQIKNSVIMTLKITPKSDMLVRTYNPRLWELRKADHKFEASLLFIVRPVLKNKNKQIDCCKKVDDPINLRHYYINLILTTKPTNCKDQQHVFNLLNEKEKSNLHELIILTLTIA
jgi:hypothetical protein